MNTFIQNKLDEFDKQLTSDGKGKYWSLSSGDVNNVRDFVEQSITDYNNHIVEKVKEIEQVEPESNGRYNACQEILRFLQDTNPKE